MRGRVAGTVRRHWLVAAPLAAGCALRALALVAYHPALLYIDTPKYLFNAWPGADPMGYNLILKAILVAGDLGTVAVIQHLVGLAIAIAIYTLLVRHGVARWLAALSVAPVLLDGYQIQIEQTIMPDVWFEAFAVAGLVALTWRPRPRLPVVYVAGLVLGSSALIRQIGEILILPAVAYLIVAARGWRRAVSGSAVLCASFAVPVVAYCTASYAASGHFRLSDVTAITGRLAAAADCATLALPAAERPLCPLAAQQARGADWLATNIASPLKRFPVPAGLTRRALVADFDTRVERQQPLRIAASILRDAVRIFALSKDTVQDGTPIERWRFQHRYPAYPPAINVGRGGQITVGVRSSTTEPFSFAPLGRALGGPAQVDRPVALFLRAYQVRGGYAPGPLLAVCALAGLAGSALAVGGRRNQPALACLLFTAAAAAVLLVSDVFEFSWRYQMPALVTLPPAGALGAWALWQAARYRPHMLEHPESGSSSVREPRLQLQRRSRRPAPSRARTRPSRANRLARDRHERHGDEPPRLGVPRDRAGR